MNVLKLLINKKFKMKVLTTKGDLYIEFRHVSPRVAQAKLDQRDHEPGEFVNQGDAGTYCTIREGGRDGTIIAQGQSVIHPLDVHSFNREKGRVISLTKALHSLFPKGIQRNKTDRTAVWTAYHNRGLPTKPLSTDPEAPWNTSKAVL